MEREWFVFNGFKETIIMARPRQTPAELLLAVVRRNEATRERIEQVLSRPPPTNPQPPTFFDHVKNTMFQGDRNLMFESLRINEAMFESTLNIIDSIPLATRGRRSFVHSHKDKLLFLLLFLTQGMGALKMACLPKIKSHAQVLNVLHDVVKLFGRTIVENTITFRREHWEDFPQCSTVVDCTVVEITGPALLFHERAKYHSGKHKKQCLKKEVIVNVRSGTAAMISDEHPGSVSDITVLRRHAREVNRMLGQSSMLADKGYRGDTLVPNVIVVGDHLDEHICAYRLIVERFFGRLKNTFIVFSQRWTMDVSSFSDFFDVACGLTNLLILVEPLNHDDFVFNNNILLMWLNEIEENEENRRVKEAARRERRRLERDELILVHLLANRGNN